jgi:hypothetical protein
MSAASGGNTMRLSPRTVVTALCLAAGLLILLSPVKAQEPAPTPAPTAAPAPSVAAVAATAAPATTTATAPSERVVLKEGTEVPLVFSADLNSKTAVDDDTVNMTLADDVKVGDVVVVKKGAPAVATVTNAHKAGMMGKPGELSIRLEYLKSDDQRLRLRGNKGKEGEGKVGATVALTVLFGPIGLIKHGKNVDIPEGTPLTAYVDQDYTLAPAK